MKRVIGLILATLAVASTSVAAAAETVVPSTGLGVQRVGSYPDATTTTAPLPWNSNRDCGFSAPSLSGRARLMVFCDTAMQDAAGGEHNYGIGYATNTLALAVDPLMGPPKPRDPLVNDEVKQSIPFPAGETCPSGKVASVWPNSAATLPDYDGDPTTDRFAVYFRAFCVGFNPFTADALNVGIAFIETDIDTPTTHLSVLNTDTANYRYPVFTAPPSEPDYDVGANVEKVGSTRYLHVFRCGDLLSQGGGCYVKRRALTGTKAGDTAALAQASAYEVLRTDDTWGLTGTPKRLNDPAGQHGGEALYYPQGGQIQWIAELGLWVMTYQPWSTFTSFGAMTAPTLAGPWSEPVRITPPTGGCSGSGLACYTPAVQPGLSSRSRVGFTFYDNNFPRQPGSTTVSTLRAATIPRSALGPTAATAPATDAAYVRWVYLTLLGRPATTAQVNQWTTYLATGTRSGFVGQIAATDEFRIRWADLAYFDIWTYRHLDANERTWYAAALQTTSWLAFERQVAALSGTYAEIVGTATGTTANEIFVDHMYQAALDRDPEPAGFDYWVDFLDGGGSRTTMAAAFLNADPSKNTRIQALYDLLLNRDADTAGLDYWRGRYSTDGSLFTVIVNLAASAEAYTEAQRSRALPLE